MHDLRDHCWRPDIPPEHHDRIRHSSLREIFQINQLDTNSLLAAAAL